MLVVLRYRRKEANARERQRQGEINTGFDKLREKIPHPGPSNGKCEKLRKIDILHVAIEYIRYWLHYFRIYWSWCGLTTNHNLYSTTNHTSHQISERERPHVYYMILIQLIKTAQLFVLFEGVWKFVVRGWISYGREGPSWWHRPCSNNPKHNQMIKLLINLIPQGKWKWQNNTTIRKYLKPDN